MTPKSNPLRGAAGDLETMGPEHRGCLDCGWDPNNLGNRTGSLCHHPEQERLWKCVPLTPCPGWKPIEANP